MAALLFHFFLLAINRALEKLKKKFSKTEEKSMTRQTFPNNLLAKLFTCSLTILVTAGFFVSTASAQTVLYNNNGGAPNSSPSGLATGATSKSGVAAPTGAQWSEVQNNAGNTAEANTSAGSTCTGTFRIADNFTVPAGQTWNITSIDTYAYQTGASPGTSPFTGATIRVWNAAPPGGMVVYGDTTTNRLGSTTFAGLYRIFNTVAPPPGTAPGTTRPIFRNTITTTGLTLTAGTYWIDYAFSGPATAFCPTTTVVDTRGLPGWNALQLTAAPSTWTPVLDAGNPATAPDIPQDFPFQINGTTGGGTTCTRRIEFDFDADCKTDYAVVRTVSGARQWYILRSSDNTVQFQNWGAGTDVLAPGDFNGDRRFDFNVWRAGTYFLQLNGGAQAVIPWGTTGDGAGGRIEGDYDGDGSDDPTVVRNVSGAFVWYVRQSSNGAPLTVTWGASTDSPLPAADWDGDGRDDIAVYRAVAGAADQYLIRQSTNGALRTISFGEFATDFIFADDFDGDGRADAAVWRAVGVTTGDAGTWYIQQSSNNAVVAVQFGIPGAAGTRDVPATGDYDGDGRYDIAVWRPSNGTYYVRQSTNNTAIGRQWGASGDTPLQSLRAR
jgi:hypothetical protein